VTVSLRVTARVTADGPGHGDGPRAPGRDWRGRRDSDGELGPDVMIMFSDPLARRRARCRGLLNGLTLPPSR
jgi:hypothetical protein